MTHGKPLVSIGVPVYNGAKYIRQALDSILGQTYKNLEVVISDNASTDETGAICVEYAARDSRIRYHRNAVNIGLLPNYRRAFELSSGDYFMWAAADDVKHPTVVEDFVAALLRNSHAVMAHGVVMLKPQGREDLVEISNEMDLSDPRPAERVRAFIRGMRHNAMLYGLYKRDAWAKGTLGDCFGNDYLLCLQMCLLGPVEYVRTPMITYRIRSSAPRDSVMYPEVPITVWNLLSIGRLRRSKCWTVLLRGCYYFFTIRGIPMNQRVRAVSAYVTTFGALYRTRLTKEIIFQLFAPVAWCSRAAWRLIRQRPSSLRLARKLQSTLMRI